MAARTKKTKPASTKKRGPFLHMEIDPELRYEARQFALAQRKDLKDWVSEAIREKIRSSPPPRCPLPDSPGARPAPQA